jgi:tetratricopeptide (TPR) repeat protein
MQRNAPFQLIVPCLALSVVGLAVGTGKVPSYAQEQGAISAPVVSQPGYKSVNANYRQAMLIGYAAAEQGDYHTALINFRRALNARPGDRYATAAIRNMEAYIARQRAEARKQQEIEQLQEVLSRAVQASDWACAASTVDRLIELVPPDSVDRARLTAYRGELGGLIQSRASLEQWSTVCLGGRN